MVYIYPGKPAALNFTLDPVNTQITGRARPRPAKVQHGTPASPPAQPPERRGHAGQRPGLTPRGRCGPRASPGLCRSLPSTETDKTKQLHLPSDYKLHISMWYHRFSDINPKAVGNHHIRLKRDTSTNVLQVSSPAQVVLELTF